MPSRSRARPIADELGQTAGDSGPVQASGVLQLIVLVPSVRSRQASYGRRWSRCRMAEKCADISACVSPFHGQRELHLVDPGQPPLPILDDLPLERGRGVTRDLDLDQPNVGQHSLGPGRVAGSCRCPTRRHRASRSRGESQSHLPAQTPGPAWSTAAAAHLPGQLQPLRPSPHHQHRDQLFVGHGRRRPGPGRPHGLHLHEDVSHLTSLS